MEIVKVVATTLTVSLRQETAATTDQRFHNVDPEHLKHITGEDSQSGNLFPGQKLDYSTPVPTRSQSIPHSSQDAWLTIGIARDFSVEPNLNGGYRGRLGGC